MIPRIIQDESGLSIADHFASAGIRTCDNRKAAGHGLQNGQIESVLKRGADVEIGCGIKGKDVRSRLFKARAIPQTKFVEQREIDMRIIAADDEYSQWKI